MIGSLAELQSRLPALRRVEGGGASLEIALARVERPETRECHLVEGSRITARAVPLDGPPVFTAFLDGVQASRDIAWLGPVPLVHGRVAAVVRQRVDARLTTWGAPRVTEALYAPWTRGMTYARAAAEESGFDIREVRPSGDAPDDPHPMRALQDAANAVKQDREAIERDLAADFCNAGAGVLYLDGGLPAAQAVHDSDRVVGVVKSHQTLYVGGDALATVLALDEGERSSAFLVESRHRPPVASWYLRLRDPQGRDPFWGLVRLEVPADRYTAGGRDLADDCSAWVVAERSPVALPDGRWDTMAYGIRSCEEFLRASLGR